MDRGAPGGLGCCIGCVDGGIISRVARVAPAGFAAIVVFTLGLALILPLAFLAILLAASLLAALRFIAAFCFMRLASNVRFAFFPFDRLVCVLDFRANFLAMVAS